MGKAFASPRRLELIDLLAQGPRSVDELARASGQSTANASQHLQALHAAGVVTRERDGTRVNYSLAGPDLLRLWLELRDASATRVAEVERRARLPRRRGGGDQPRGAPQAAPSQRRRARRRAARGGVRRRPHRRRRSRSRSTSSTSGSPSCRPDSEIVAYCRGALLRVRPRGRPQAPRRGRSARRLEGGWPEWQLAEQAEP